MGPVEQMLRVQSDILRVVSVKMTIDDFCRGIPLPQYETDKHCEHLLTVLFPQTIHPKSLLNFPISSWVKGPNGSKKESLKELSLLSLFGL